MVALHHSYTDYLYVQNVTTIFEKTSTKTTYDTTMTLLYNWLFTDKNR